MANLKTTVFAAECEHCTRRTTRRCEVIIDPLKLWQENGDCWAYTADPNWFKKYKNALNDYKANRGEL